MQAPKHPPKTHLQFPAFYDILELNQNASDQQINSAFKTLSLKYHPDKGGSTAAQQQVNNAKDFLLNRQKRNQYDDMLHFLENTLSA